MSSNCPNGFTNVSELKKDNLIRQTTHELSVSFAPKISTTSSLNGNKITIMGDNTCEYKEQGYKLIDIQICSAIHTGFKVQTNKPPIAELIFTFNRSSNNGNTDVTNILFCLPIIIGTNNPYLQQLVTNPIPSKEFTITDGIKYAEDNVNGNNKIDGISLASCVDKASTTQNVLGYDYNNKICRLFESTGSVYSDVRYISGTISGTSNNLTTVTTYPSLDSIFNTESISYRMCPDKRKMHVYIFPDGITVTQNLYNQLLLQMGGKLLKYKYGTDIVINTALRCGTQDKFYYYPVKPGTKVVGISSTNTCPYLQHTTYKCMPLNQLSKIAGDTNIKGQTLSDIVKKSCILPSTSPTTSTTEIETPQIVLFNELTPADIGAIFGIGIFSLCIVAGFAYFIKKNAIE